MFRRFSILIIFILISPSLFSQTGYYEKQKRVDHKIKTITMYSCQPLFGERDTCRPISITRYDKKGNETEIISSPGETYSIFTYYKYNAANKRIEYGQIYGKDTTRTKYEYDAQGNEIRWKSYKNRKLITVDSSVYENGKRIYSVNYSVGDNPHFNFKNKYDQNGNRIECQTLSGKDTVLTTYFYDNTNKLVKMISYDSDKSVKSTTLNFYANDTIVLTRTIKLDGSVSEKKLEYDDKKRLTLILNRDSGKVVSWNSNKYVYDANGNMIEDEYSDSRPSTMAHRYEYDPSGNLISKTSLTGSSDPVVRGYIYNSDGKLTKTFYTTSRLDSVIVEYVYDAKSGNKIRETSRQGKMIRTSDFVYDEKGNLTNEKQYLVLANDSLVLFTEIDFENDLSGKPVKATYKDYASSLMMLIYTSDPNKFLQNSKKAVPSVFILDYVYDPRDSLVETYIDPTTAQASWASVDPVKCKYGANGKKSEQDFFHPDGKQLRYKYLYEYDKKGNLIAQKCMLGGQSETNWTIRYSYDAQNRLTDKCTYSIQGELTEHIRYMYDASGRVFAEKQITRGGDSYDKYVYETY